MMASSTAGPLKDALREVRAAAREFVSAGGANGVHFEDSSVLFRTAVMALRLIVARQVELIIQVFGMQPTAEVRSILSVIEENRR